MMRSLIVFFFFISISVSAYQPAKYELSSPDGKLHLQFYLDTDNALTYQLNYQGKSLLAPSQLGFAMENDEQWRVGFQIVSVSMTEKKEEWQPVYGEKAVILDQYRQMNVMLRRKENDADQLNIIFRLYDEGLAYCYHFPSVSEKTSINIKRDYSAFTFQEDFPIWVSSRAQSEISRIKINEVKEEKERPLVLEIKEDLFAAIGEAALIDFPRMKWVSDSLKANTLTTALSSKASFSSPYTTPWRYIMVAKNPGKLLENNYFILNLNAPNTLKETSWIRPGKVIREVTLTTQGGLACIDFAKEKGLQYVEFDAGWYGPEAQDSSDATTVTVDPKRSPGPLDLPKVLEYAQSKDIGILLYVNRRALEKQLDEILPLYQSWGVKGIKFGFVQVGTQEWTQWLHHAVRKAAEYQLMVDIHDEYRPTGYSRTYPNLMTQEGIRGDEESPSTTHTLTTLFTRMIAGAGDNTICYYAPRVTDKMGGHGAQLAKSVLLYSPWQFLYWYDRPEGSPHQKGGAGASNGNIGTEPELEFFKEIPTVWDDTKVLEGAIARYATIARKSGNQWFIGSLTAENRTIDITLDFLSPNQAYEALFYLDDPKADNTTKISIQKRKVKRSDHLSFTLEKDRGLAIQIYPID